MHLRKRRPGEKRWGIPVEFPLTDSNGVRVTRNRRSGVDRRKTIASFEELLVLFSAIPAGAQERKR